MFLEGTPFYGEGAARGRLLCPMWSMGIRPMSGVLDQLKTARIVDGSATMMELSDHIIESIVAEIKRLRSALQIIASEGDHMARWAIVDYATTALSCNRPAISLLPIPFKSIERVIVDYFEAKGVETLEVSGEWRIIIDDRFVSASGLALALTK